MSDEARDDFLRTVRETAESIAAGDIQSGATIVWYEEAELTRVPDEDGGVTVLNALISDAVHVDEHTHAETRKAVLKALPKFQSRWADRHILVLEGSPLTTPTDVTSAMQALAKETDLSVVDEVLLLSDNTLSPVWPT